MSALFERLTNPYVVISFISVVILAILIFHVEPNRGNKERIAREAANIAKRFGDSSITLFKFPTYEEQFGKGERYFLIEFNPRIDNEDDLVKHRNYYEVDSWTEKGANTRKSTDKYWNSLRQALPYDIRECVPPISLSEYFEPVRKFWEE